MSSKRKDMTVDEVIHDLKVLISYFAEEFDAVPICMDKAVELLEEKSTKENEQI